MSTPGPAPTGPDQAHGEPLDPDVHLDADAARVHAEQQRDEDEWWDDMPRLGSDGDLTSWDGKPL